MVITFRSKIDWWLAIPFVVAFAGILLSAYVAFMLGSWLMLLLPIGCATFISWITFGTFYHIDDSILLVRSGPFRWQIPIKEIRTIVPTHNPLSSPALSLDRLRIEYGNGRSIMVSPADKEGFQAAIEQARY